MESNALGRVLRHVGEEAKSRVKALNWKRMDHSAVRGHGTPMGEGHH